MGRPSKFTEIKATKIIEGLQAGMTRVAAAGLVEVSVESLSNWAKSHPDFSARLVAAENQAEARYTAVIARAANDGDWQAARYWLSRRRRKDWGDSLHVDLDVEIKQLLHQLAGQPMIEIERTDSESTDTENE